jgi:hypothetical protein
MTVRAQTTIDFAVGMGLFLVIVAFVFAFLPSLFAPFDSDSGASLVAADRSADRLANDLLLTDPSEPGMLDRQCTHAFFATDPMPTDCGASENADALETALFGDAVPTRSVAVSLEDHDGNVYQFADGTTLEAGGSPPSNGDVVVASRAVVLTDQHLRLYVRVW